jgi:hypothetical protein
MAHFDVHYGKHFRSFIQLATARPGSVPCPARVRPCGRLRGRPSAMHATSPGDDAHGQPSQTPPAERVA